MRLQRWRERNIGGAPTTKEVRSDSSAPVGDGYGMFETWCAEIGIPVHTGRRNVEDLQARGLLRRTHRGAVNLNHFSISPSGPVFPFSSGSKPLQATVDGQDRVEDYVTGRDRELHGQIR